MNIGIVGARGVVGAQLVAALERRNIASEQVRLFGTELDEVDYEADTVNIEPLGPNGLKGLKVVVLATPSSAAKDLAQAAQQLGIWVVDLSGAHRLNNDIPLVAPGVNDAVLDRPFKGRIVSLASPEATALTQVLFSVDAQWKLLAADCNMLLSSSHFGKTGVERLSKQSASLLNGVEAETEPFPHRLAFNVIAGAGPIEKGLTESERRVLVEAVRIFSPNGVPALTATAVMVPAFHGSTLLLSLLVERPVSAEQLTAHFRKDSAMKVIDEPEAQVVPMTLLTHDDSTVHLGRIRSAGQRIQLVAAVDNAYLLADRALDIAFELGERE